ncbi:DNA primase large subunit [Plakobranchus ocellatus]|uniref:DNA primase large subunit n=1 Tax=Plakobranchus ocellatus TaxID=259542 RepID=A0AAV4DBV7_9GAST|nr:DNA primase large subunit [Plakobranchus ocellatus]
MEFGTRSKPRARVVNSSDSNESNLHHIQLYSVAPTDTISLQEFEELAVERLKVLKAVETIGITHQKGTAKYYELLSKEIAATKLKDSFLKKTQGDEVQRRKRDQVSHFILRLAYCRSEDLRRWFLNQELDLFRFRFQQEDRDSRAHFLVSNNLKYKPVK